MGSSASAVTLYLSSLWSQLWHQIRIHLGSGCGRSCEISCASTAAAQAAPAAGFRGAASGGCPRVRKPVTMIWGPHSSVHMLCIFNLILRDWTSKIIHTSSTLVCCVVHGGSELRHPHCL